MDIKSYNPANGLLMTAWPFMPAALIDKKLQLAASAHNELSLMSALERGQLLLNLSDLILAQVDYWSTLITVTMGKPITQSRSEVEKSCKALQYFAKELPRALEPKVIASSYTSSYRLLQPLGCILAVMPWNYPLWQVVRVLAPNIMLGNSIVLSHAPNVFVVSKVLEQAIAHVMPAGSLVAILQDYCYTKSLIGSDYIQGLAFTGSDKVGGLLASYAGAAIKPATLECGGSDPYLVLSDADLDLASDIVIKMRLNNAGQVCISAKRIIVEAAVYSEFIELLKAKIQGVSYSDPMLDQTVIGPLARLDIRDQVHKQVIQTIAAGATCIQGGELPNTSGYYYPITLLTGVEPGMPAFDAEVFGPVIAVTRAANVEDAIKLANSHIYGLGAAVFTQDLEQGDVLARKLNAGFCAINSGISSDPALPFGGIKRSGFGRELGAEGLEAFANIKVIIS